VNFTTTPTTPTPALMSRILCVQIYPDHTLYTGSLGFTLAYTVPLAFDLTPDMSVSRFYDRCTSVIHWVHWFTLIYTDLHWFTLIYTDLLSVGVGHWQLYNRTLAYTDTFTLLHWQFYDVGKRPIFTPIHSRLHRFTPVYTDSRRFTLTPMTILPRRLSHTVLHRFTPVYTGFTLTPMTTATTSRPTPASFYIHVHHRRDQISGLVRQVYRSGASSLFSLSGCYSRDNWMWKSDRSGVSRKRNEKWSRPRPDQCRCLLKSSFNGWLILYRPLSRRLYRHLGVVWPDYWQKSEWLDPPSKVSNISRPADSKSELENNIEEWVDNLDKYYTFPCQTGLRLRFIEDPLES